MKMKSPIFLIVIVGFLAAELEAESQPTPYSNLVDKIKDLVVYFLNQQIEYVKSIAKALIDFEKYTNDIISKFNISATNLIGAAIGTITDLSTKAAGKTVNFTACKAKIAISQLETMPSKITEELEKCIKPLFDTANEYVSNGESRLENISGKIDDFNHKAKECGRDLMCLGKLYVEMTTYSVNATLALPKIAGETISSIASLQLSALQCTTNILRRINEDVFGIVHDVSECLQKIIE